MKTSGISHLNLRVSDLERSAKFYCELFGMKEAFREMPSRIFLKTGKDLLTLSRGQVPTRKWGIHFGFEVSDRKQVLLWRKLLKQMGIEIIQERKEESGGGLYFRDPDGYLIEIYYEKE